MTIKNIQSKPLIRWAGSKRKLLPILVANTPEVFERYIEPFCGSACLFFELKPAKAILSDINTDLINALKAIQANPYIREQLIKIENCESEYYRIRLLDPSTLSNKNRAIRFLYLNRYCFNGVYRTNLSGKFNVPRGKNTGSFPAAEIFEKASHSLQNAELKVSDYSVILSELRAGDFVYIDPPYSKSGRFTGEYGVGSFNSNDLPKFIESLKALDKREVKFLFSYRACEDVSEALDGLFNVQILSVKRHISGFKKKWGESQEILVKNYG
ncbi:MAG: hypothetical protein OFPII_41280 [Osedax symbiont Rs1]|nr:MAG: hypothetical protein OFPII_41280 [Osedax symbiont Rs1]